MKSVALVLVLTVGVNLQCSAAERLRRAYVCKDSTNIQQFVDEADLENVRNSICIEIQYNEVSTTTTIHRCVAANGVLTFTDLRPLKIQDAKCKPIVN